MAAKTLTQSFRETLQYTPDITQATGHDLFTETTVPRANFTPNSVPVSGQPLSVLVQDAYLECFPLALHQQIIQFAQEAKTYLGNQPLEKMVIIPVFLLAGTHVMEDIPAEVALAQTLMGETTNLITTSHFGSHVGLQRIITEAMATYPFEAWVLLAHGSRYRGANQTIENIANSLGAIAAYWSVEPKLATRTQELADAGVRRVGIFPYFLFSGAITEAISQAVSQLSQQWPQVSLTLMKPLEASQELANLLVDFTQKH